MSLMSLYQQLYSFKGIVFTENAEVRRYAALKNLLVFGNLSKNRYGLPYINDIVKRMVKAVGALYYGYMNSDILLNPSIFNIIPLIQTKADAGIISRKFTIFSRVRDVTFPINESAFLNEESMKHAFSQFENNRLRNQYCIVWFVKHLHCRIYSFGGPHFHSISYLVLSLVDGM